MPNLWLDNLYSKSIGTPAQKRCARGLKPGPEAAPLSGIDSCLWLMWVILKGLSIYVAQVDPFAASQNIYFYGDSLTAFVHSYNFSFEAQ